MDFEVTVKSRRVSLKIVIMHAKLSSVQITLTGKLNKHNTRTSSIYVLSRKIAELRSVGTSKAVGELDVYYIGSEEK